MFKNFDCLIRKTALLKLQEYGGVFPDDEKAQVPFFHVTSLEA
jgi:hypothetical protein